MSFKSFLVMCGVIGLVGYLIINFVVSHVINPITTGEEIGMCQPTGWNLNRDAKCAQDVNVPNSIANANNGQYHQSVAVATAIVGANDRANGEQFKSGAVNGAFFTFPFACCFGIVLVIGGFFALVKWTSRGENSNADTQ